MRPPDGGAETPCRVILHKGYADPCGQCAQSPCRPPSPRWSSLPSSFQGAGREGRRLVVPVELGECCEPLEADRGTDPPGPPGPPGAPGGLPPALRGDPGGRLSVTDMSAAMGEGPLGPLGALGPAWPLAGPLEWPPGGTGPLAAWGPWGRSGGEPVRGPIGPIGPRGDTAPPLAIGMPGGMPGPG